MVLFLGLMDHPRAYVLNPKVNLSFNYCQDMNPIHLLGSQNFLQLISCREDDAQLKFNSHLEKKNTLMIDHLYYSCLKGEGV